MVRLVKFKKEHLEVMDIRDHEQNVINVFGHAEMLEQSVAITGVVDGRVLCCGGVLPFGMGNSDIWLIPSIYVPQYKKTFCVELKKWLFQVREDLALNRMQTECIDDDLHTSWMESLGFTHEGTRRKYFNGLDYKSWGRTWE